MQGILLSLPSPFDILNEKNSGDAVEFTRGLGLPQLANIIQVTGVICAVIMIFCAFIMLLVVNYPKTVSQTKTKIVHACFVVIIIASMPYIADLFLTVITGALGINFGK